MSSNEESDTEILTKLLETAEKDTSVKDTKTCLETDNPKFLEDVVNFESQVIEKDHIFKNQLDSNITNNNSNSKLGYNHVSHNENTESSDEEKCNHDFKYSQYGKEIKDLLTHENKYIKHTLSNKPTWKTKQSDLSKSNVLNVTNKENKHLLAPCSSSEAQCKNSETYVDPTFGIRIINPLISKFQIKEKMIGRQNVTMSQIQYFLLQDNKDIDWVICGVIVSKSNTKVSQNGNQYIIWTISDLKRDLKSVSVFLFRAAHKNLWKLSKGTVVAILNPNVLEKRDGYKEEASLSIDIAERVLILGQSKDLGVCKSKKLNGEQCTAFVNVSNCEYCVYHVKQEYKKMSMRSELQSSCAGRGLNALRNKVLGKNEVFYAGKSYMAIPAKKSRKLVEKDSNILNCLSKKSFYSESKLQNKNTNRTAVNKQNARRLETSVKQRLKDIERLKKLGGTEVSSEVFNLENSNQNVKCDTAKSTVITPEVCKKNVCDILSKLKTSKLEVSIPNIPIISEEVYSLSPLFVNKSSLKRPALKQIEEAKDPHLKLTDSKRKLSDLSNNDLIANNKKSEKKEKESLLIDKTNISHESKVANNLENTFLNKCTSDSKTNLTLSKNVCLNENLEKNNTTPIKHDNFEKKDIKSAFQNDKTSSQNLKIKDHSSIVNENSIKTNCNSLVLPLNIPSLNKGKQNSIDFSIPVNRRVMNSGRMKALSWVAKNGPILKEDPSSTKGRGVKRVRPDLFENTNSEVQKDEEMTVKSKKFREIMEIKSAHSELIEFHDHCVQENYFNKLEKIEKMEEKMMSVFKLECKAVRCLKCKYTNFSASNLCKVEGHPLKVFDTFKRFFMCSDCKNRTVTLDILPLVSCKKCGGNKWERTSMMKEKIANIDLKLSIRGDEQKFVDSFTTSSNLNLLVPE